MTTDKNTPNSKTLSGNDKLRACDRVITQIASATPIGEILLQIATNMEKLDTEMHCTITLINGDLVGQSFSPKLPAFFGQVFEDQKIGLDSCSYGRVAFSKKALYISDINEDPSWQEYREIVGRSGLRSCIIEPVLSSFGEICGIFSVYYRKVQPIEVTNQRFFAQAVELASIALERYILEKKLTEQADSIKSLDNKLVAREKELHKNLQIEKHQFIKSFIHDLRVPLNSILGFTKMLSISDLENKHKEIVHEIENASNRLLEISNESATITQPEFVVEKRNPNSAKQYSGVLGRRNGDKKSEKLDNVTSSHSSSSDKETAVIAAVDVIDCSVLEFSTGPDRKMHSHLMKVFLESVHDTMQRLESAINTTSFSDIQFTAHKLKSAAKSIGAKNFAHTSELIELEVSEKNPKSIDQLYQDLSREIIELEDFVDNFSGDIIVSNSDAKKPRNIQSLEVLVVDDDVFIIEQMRAVLARMGVKGISSANGGEKALQILQNNRKIDIVICDLNMPGMNGIEFFAHLDDMHYPGGLILVSSEENRLVEAAGAAKKSRNINVLGALSKPLSPQTLYNLLEKNKQHFSKTDKMLVEDVTLNELHNAIHSQQLVIYYQPQIEMKTRKVIGVEAVVRWLRPKRGLLPPDLFIYLAEENNLIDDLTQEVFEQAMNQGVKWHSMGYDLDLSLNLSVDSIKRTDLQEWLINVAAKSGLSPEKVNLELKENKLSKNILLKMELLTGLGLAGYNFSIDDFGAGVSNFENLQGILFKELKIKRAYVSAAPQDEACQAIVESSIALAKIYKMNTVAKGVDTQEQWDLLEKLGCDVVQGYYIAKPMPAEKFTLWLKNRKH